MFHSQSLRFPASLALMGTFALCSSQTARAQESADAGHGQGPYRIYREAENPTLQQGSHKHDRKAGASAGEVLGEDFGSAFGDFAQYAFNAELAIPKAFLTVKYARQLAGNALLAVTLDGAPVGTVTCPSTGGWGDTPNQIGMVRIALPDISKGQHVLRLTVVPGSEMVTTQEKKLRPKAVPVLELVGNRTDKNTVGHGNNVALYTGSPSRFFYATHELGDIFSAVDGGTINWYPDYVTVAPQSAAGNINLDNLEITDTVGAALLPDQPFYNRSLPDPITEVRQVCVTKDDVVVSRLHFQNSGATPITRRVEVSGDCRGSFDWRGNRGGEKITRREGNTILMFDKNVFPNVLPEGLAMAIGGNATPSAADTSTAGTYRLTYEVTIPAGGERDLLLACALERSGEKAQASLKKVLAQSDPIKTNRADWQHFYENEVPQFDCSDKRLSELYAFRWFLLKFSTAGGDLGLFKYPVVMEGRQAFQTYCCYSAPFMAFDMNWASDPKVGFGHIANMGTVAFEDGRFPWYASPRTNDVPLDHRSKTGASLLPYTAWEWYQIHGDKAALRQLYPVMKKNQQWWIADRDGDGNGLFSIDHQLETGMDDLHRRWKTGKPARYEAVDATSYAILNLEAVTKMARELGETADATYFANYAKKSATALQTICWDATLQRFRDRNPETGELSDYNSICTFYPMMTDAMQSAQMAEVQRYLLNPKEFWTAYPIPALSQSDPEFDPIKRYWAGPSWPAATSHVVEGFAQSAKKLDRSLLPQAAQLFKRAANIHLQPRPDFYEHYDPITGAGLSNFRDYMHSWWIDIYIRHIAGMEPQDDGSLVIDPLPMELDWYELRGAPHRGHSVDVLLHQSGKDVGLTVRVDKKTVLRDKKFHPGDKAVTIPAARF